MKETVTIPDWRLRLSSSISHSRYLAVRRKRKLAPRYIRPFEILEVCGPVAYRLQLPPQLTAIHDIFHVSQLRKCVKVPTEIIDPQTIEIQSDLTYTEHLIRVLDTKQRSTRRETIKMFKIQWNHHTEEEATWETESYLQ
jgi:hypothetical protein